MPTLFCTIDHTGQKIDELVYGLYACLPKPKRRQGLGEEEIEIIERKN